MENDELLTVYTAPNNVKAEIVKNFLEAESIQCFLEGEESAANVGFPAFHVKVLVPAADAARARELIEEHERQVEIDSFKEDEDLPSEE